jgi:hypothetical protein
MGDPTFVGSNSFLKFEQQDWAGKNYILTLVSEQTLDCVQIFIKVYILLVTLIC